MADRLSGRKRRTAAALAGALLILGLSKEAAFAAEWIRQDGGWYYYQQDGSPGKGWIEDKGRFYYLTEEGRCLTDCITPDGYYVDESGAWYQRKISLLDVSFQAPDRFPAPDQPWTGAGSMVLFGGSIEDVFRKRTIRTGENKIEYLSGKAQTVLAGLYKEPEKGRYRLDLAIGLDRSSDSSQAAATYDYAVFQALVYQISSSPELLEEAIYSSWQETNTWQIRRDGRVRVGDCQVSYVSDTGCGHYYIYPAVQE